MTVPYNNSGPDHKRLSTNFDYNNDDRFFIAVIRFISYYDTLFFEIFAKSQ